MFQSAPGSTAFSYYRFTNSVAFVLCALGGSGGGGGAIGTSGPTVVGPM